MYTFRLNEVLRYWELIAEGALRSIGLTAVTATLGLILGTGCALVLVYGGRRWHPIVLAYVELFRNTPFLVQLFVIFFGLASGGIRLDANVAAILALSLNFGAYTTEIVRAGIQSVPKGQLESAVSLGLAPRDVFFSVIAFQAFRNVYRSLVSYVVLLFLGTSVVSQISAEDLMRAGSFIDSRTFRSFEVYTVISLVYLAIVLMMRALGAAGWTLFFRRRG